MNRSDISCRLSELYPDLKRKEVDFLVRKLLNLLTSSIATGKRVEVRGFACFSLKERSSDKIRNPRKNVILAVDEKRHAVYFRAGKELKERVNITSS